jgi:DNA replication protein DnaC
VKAQLAHLALLILDDFGIKPLTPQERHDLFGLIEDLHLRRAAIITSQPPTSARHDYLQEPKTADALLDRLLHRAYRVELSGHSLYISGHNLDQLILS